jgi:hypothetical protein
MASRGRSARRKGSDFERQVAAILADQLGAQVQRTLLSGIRGEGDIEGLPVHLELKRQEQTRLAKWYAAESPKAGRRPFAIIHKRNGEPIFVTMEINDWIHMFRETLCTEEDVKAKKGGMPMT